jgi:formylmethanofuran--tetrahydromethanopterin N-formyltransferase
VPTELPPRATAAYEIVIDGLTLEAVERATARGIRAACHAGQGTLIAISAGNYGGKLGPYHIKLRETLDRYADAGAEGT